LVQHLPKRQSEKLQANIIGIIGLSFFKNQIVTIDYQNRKLILQKGRLAANKNALVLNESPILESNITVGTNVLPAHFDCGAPSFISIPAGMKDKCKFKTTPVLIGRARTVGGEMDILAAQLDGNITIGSIMLKDPKIELLTADFPAVNIGYRFFSKYLVGIDYAKKLLIIKGSPRPRYAFKYNVQNESKLEMYKYIYEVTAEKNQIKHVQIGTGVLMKPSHESAVQDFK
jgi:hypothetical protein